MGTIIWSNIYKLTELAWRRRYLIFVPFVITFILTCVVSLFSAKVYRAHTSILVQESALLNPFLEDLSVSFNLEDRMVALKVLVHSRHVLLQVAQQNELITQQRDAEKTIKLLSNSIGLSLSGNDLVKISLTWAKPEKMKAILISIRKLFIQQLLAPSRASIVSSEKFLLSQLQHRRELLEQSEAKMADFRREHQGVLPELFIENNKQLTQIHNEIREKEIELSGATGQLDSIKLKLAQTNPVVGVVEEQIVIAEANLTLLLAKYTRQHSKVKAVQQSLNYLKAEQKRLLSSHAALTEEQINQLWNLASVVDGSNSENAIPALLLSQLERVQAAQATIKELNNEITMLKKQADSLTNKISLEANVTRELASLERDLSVNTTLYHDLLNRHEMAKVTGELGRFEEPEKIKIIDRAFTPNRASNMPFAVFAVLGMVLGLVVGCAIAIITEVLDDTIWHESQIKTIAQLDIICRIPAN